MASGNWMSAGTPIDTLRAQAHEFTNKLHTVAGLVELGEYNEVIRYITLASQGRVRRLCSPAPMIFACWSGSR
jgi:hypothetical protein